MGSLDRERHRFDRWSRWYDLEFLQRAVFARPQRAVVKAIPAVPAAVLDVGCGTGRLLRLVADRYPEAQLVGVDLSPGMIEVARANAARGGQVEFVVADAASLPFPAEAFDLALSTISFHHWPDAATGLREIRRVLKPGGHFILADVVVGGLPQGVRTAIEQVWGERLRAAATVRQLLLAAGLKVVAERRPASLLKAVLILVATPAPGTDDSQVR